MFGDTHSFRIRLSKKTGYSESAIKAAWPEWWSNEAETSPSAQAELRFSIARKLGLDPRSMLGDDSPQFMWDDSAKYKNFSGTEAEQLAITAFGTSVGRILINGVTEERSIEKLSARDLRDAILKQAAFVGITELLSFLWGVGIPTIHLQVHPLAAKRMCAMAVSVNGKFAILLARNAEYPAMTIFHLAHEIGHIVLGHVNSGSAVIDMKDPSELNGDGDEEEVAADAFAIELLTGARDFAVTKVGEGRNPMELAVRSQAIGFEHGIEPGTVALCYGYSTKEWATAQSAMRYIYDAPASVWKVVNRVAVTQINWDRLGYENASFIQAVMGGRLE